MGQLCGNFYVWNANCATERRYGLTTTLLTSWQDWARHLLIALIIAYKTLHFFQDHEECLQRTEAATNPISNHTTGKVISTILGHSIQSRGYPASMQLLLGGGNLLSLHELAETCSHRARFYHLHHMHTVWVCGERGEGDDVEEYRETLP